MFTFLVALQRILKLKKIIFLQGFIILNNIFVYFFSDVVVVQIKQGFQYICFAKEVLLYRVLYFL